MEKMKAELNELENDPAYLYGRIMAILANIQYAALGDVGAAWSNAITAPQAPRRGLSSVASCDSRKPVTFPKSNRRVGE